MSRDSAVQRNLTCVGYSLSTGAKTRLVKMLYSLLVLIFLFLVTAPNPGR